MPLLRQSHRLTIRLAFAAALFSASFSSIVHSATPPSATSREMEVKAAALYNIIVFTEWPTTAFADANAPLVVGVLGRGPITDLLHDLIANEMWRGRKVVLQHYSSPAEVKDCQVLYVGHTEHDQWPRMRTRFAGRPVLTASDAPDFARNGGIVQFGLEHNRLKLTVNLTAARAAGLTISSKVLRLADVVGEPSE